MQATCPQCSNKIVVDDAKVPDRAFNVKCPKCAHVLKLPGKAAPATDSTLPPAPLPGAEASGSTEEARAQMMAQVRREMSLGEGKTGGRAIVALPDRALAGAMASTLARNGYTVDNIEDWEEGARLLEQGVYGVVVTARAAAQGKGESLYQRINRLNPENRRRLFVILVGDEFKTGDGTQAFVTLADLVVNARDAATADGPIRNTVAERTRIWQVFMDARHRFEASAG